MNMLTTYVIYVIVCLILVGIVGGISKAASYGINELRGEGYVLVGNIMKMVVGVMNISIIFYAYETVLRHLFTRFM